MDKNENNLGNIFDAFEDNEINTPNENSEEDISTSSEIEIDVPNENSEEDTNIIGLEVFNNPQKDIQNESSPNVLSSNDVDEDIVKPFDANKISADSAINAGKPPVLNRNFILTIISIVFTGLVIFAVVIFPLITQKKAKDDSSKLFAEENTPIDYSSFVDKKNYQSHQSQPISVTSADTTKQVKYIETEKELPPIEYKSEPLQESQGYSDTNSSTVREIPDTSRDNLQAKTIAGIKGISNTQRQYLQDSGTLNNQLPPANAQTANSANPYAKFGLPDKNTYTQQMLGSTGAGATNTENSYFNQNDQSGKNQFYSSNRGNISGNWLPLNTIWQGSIFEAVLTSNINTDLPGECTAVITKNVYSSQDGSLLLIPMNSKLFGSYNSSISYSQRRIQVGWHTLIRPDGYQQSLGNMIATDAQGASGLPGFLNDHPFQYLKALALMSAFNIISTEFNNLAANNQNQYVQNIAADSQNIANTLGSKLIDRAMDVQPTISISGGTKINIVANTNLTLPPLEDFPVTEQYHR